MVETIVNLLDDLMDILEAEKEIYTKLLSISKDKVRILVEGKINELDQMVKAEQIFITDIGKLEDKREQIAEKIAENSGIPKEQLNINHLKSIQPIHKDEIDAVQSQINELLIQLKEANDINTQLIQHSLDYINNTINLVVSSQEQKTNYNPKAKESGTASFFDRKA
jgi:flagellar biosynthesis/type III secretory pathway chaperone